jgi:hypothetical protein
MCNNLFKDRQDIVPSQSTTVKHIEHLPVKEKRPFVEKVGNHQVEMVNFNFNIKIKVSLNFKKD